MQSTSNITLAGHSKTHAIKTSNTVLIIMFPIVPFHQGFQTKCTFLRDALHISNSDGRKPSSLPLLTCAQSSNCI